jgi:hypothetical protein
MVSVIYAVSKISPSIECHYAEWHYIKCHYAECYYAECHYAECHYAECHYAECHGAPKFITFLKFCPWPFKFKKSSKGRLF